MVCNTSVDKVSYYILNEICVSRYYELRPQYDKLQKKIEELEKEKEELVAKYKDNEEKHKSTYLQMFNKGQEAALFSVSIVLSFKRSNPCIYAF